MQASQLNQIVSLFKVCGFKSAKLLAQTIFIIISIGNIGLYKIACRINSKATKHDSKERSLRRLLDRAIGAEIYANFIDMLFHFSNDCFEFAIDRTNWKLGKTAINLFVLSFNWHGIAIPLHWMFLDNNGGNSNISQRIALLSWFLQHYKARNILNLFADREFPSIEFLRFLLEQKVNFIFRIKDNVIASDRVKGKLTRKKLSRLFRDLANGNFTSESTIRKLLDNRLFVSAKRNTNGELIVLASNQFHQDLFTLYGHRWNIECLFNKAKTKGFNMEDSHVTKPHRVVTLFTLVAIAYAYCCFIGELKHSIKPIKDKYLKGTRQKSKSIFRAGLDVIQHIIALAAYSYKAIFSQLIKAMQGKPLKRNYMLYNIMLNF